MNKEKTVTETGPLRPLIGNDLAFTTPVHNQPKPNPITQLIFFRRICIDSASASKPCNSAAIGLEQNSQDPLSPA